ncbi:MAG: hypothetical protein AAGC60_08090 [Acidobacteriota bacterium]
MRRSVLTLAAACMLALLVAGPGTAPAAADVIVLRDGSRIVTDGPWETRGRLVRFTLPDGTLGSVRASEVDAEASAEATREAEEAAQREAEEAARADEETPRKKPEPVLVLTDKDVRRADSDVVDSAQNQADLANVRVLDWDYEELESENPPYRIVGTVRNIGLTGVEDIIVSIQVIGVDANGGSHSDVVVEGRARLDAERLDAGAETQFDFPIDQRQLIATGNPSFFSNPRVEFEVKSRSEGTSEDELGEP